MFRFNFETAASSEAKPNGFAASINKTIYNLKVQRTIKLKTENFNRKNVRFIWYIVCPLTGMNGKDIGENAQP